MQFLYLVIVYFMYLCGDFLNFCCLSKTCSSVGEVLCMQCCFVTWSLSAANYRSLLVFSYLYKTLANNVNVLRKHHRNAYICNVLKIGRKSWHVDQGTDYKYEIQKIETSPYNRIREISKRKTLSKIFRKRPIQF